ncbi:hypothetical protein BEL04_14675 [Mucilaginibacter sp. PPCGB 2223]|uniref:phage tail protein n=1 Tax=Mucilaginibacter sp. PPCGB 2223 TaxID=1886027 RepID=UPI00082664D0|nr:tail fiber protein [Mucilaginibacter sp. PPCGB 2223]OCX52688.1 hypothetical protein BEL04_14675 [Mucilaginibacter sp. PPCGB 2223]
MDPFVGEIRTFSFGKIPNGWMACNGQSLQIKQYAALYALIGTYFGGDGVNTFNLPNLQGATVVADYLNRTSYKLGATGGTETVALTTATTPAHAHYVIVNTNVPTANVQPAASYLSPLALHQTTAATPLVAINGYAPAATGSNPPAPANPVVLPAATIGTDGAGAAHNNMSPYLTMNVCIATLGNFPPRN